MAVFIAPPFVGEILERARVPALEDYPIQDLVEVKTKFQERD